MHTPWKFPQNFPTQVNFTKQLTSFSRLRIYRGWGLRMLRWKGFRGWWGLSLLFKLLHKVARKDTFLISNPTPPPPFLLFLQDIHNLQAIRQDTEHKTLGVESAPPTLIGTDLCSATGSVKPLIEASVLTALPTLLGTQISVQDV